MATGFNDIVLSASGSSKVKLPKGFGASSAVGTVVELRTNNRLGESSIYLELFNKKGSAETVTKSTVKNFLKYVKRDLSDGLIFHRSVPGFVIQAGGFSAPLAPAEDGGRVEPIETFNTIVNQPGNLNLRGTIAMAKLAQAPDSASSQWFINLADNPYLDTDNGGFTVFGKVLGSGMEVADDLALADTYNFGGPFAQLPLWELESDGSGSMNIMPEDFVTIETTQKLKAKKQPFVLTVESSDKSLVTAKVTKKQTIKLNAAGSTAGQAQISVQAISDIDGTAYEDTFDVVINGGNAQGRSPGGNARKRKGIDVYVDQGDLNVPFYKFFDADGDELTDFKLNVKKKYRFHRLDGAATHPFFLSDEGFNQPPSDALKLKGDGDFDDGIVGDETIVLRIKKSDRKAFKANGELSYFCTSHPSMIGLISIKGQSRSSVDPNPIATDDSGSASDEISYYRIGDAVETSLPLI